MRIEWSRRAIRDLDRFALFLSEHHPELSGEVAGAIITKMKVLADHPRLGRPLAGRPEYRQLVLRVLGGTYVFRYRFDGERLVILRVLHGREER
ncbi:MAG: type II toxin-antitoxin system RelE/ParE family toxin [Parvibaculaceae bacterium]